MLIYRFKQIMGALRMRCARVGFRKKRGRRGFTLVEVLAVLVIFALLAAITVPGVTRWLDRARELRDSETAQLLRTAAQNRLNRLRADEPEAYAAFCALIPADGAATYPDGAGAEAVRILLGESGLLSVVGRGSVRLELDAERRNVLRAEYGE